MATTEELKRLHAYGYDSGDVLRWRADATRKGEERVIGGSYRRFFMRAVRPHLERSSLVLELGPGRGSWTRALLRYVPDGAVHTVDYLDVSPWLPPDEYGGRLVCHQVDDNSFSTVPDGTMRYAEFMSRVGTIKAKPASWKELFFSPVHALPGS